LSSPFDLHVLATPPAFVLSQDQTLQFDSSKTVRRQVLSIKGSTLLAIRTESAEIIVSPRESGVNFKLIPAGRFPPKLLHFRCFSNYWKQVSNNSWFGLTVNL
jgi:hypothetical protein